MTGRKAVDQVRALALVGGVLLAGCSTTALHGLTPAWQQRGHDLGTAQKCLYQPEAIDIADRALVLYAQEAVAQGLAKSYEQVARSVGTPGVCVIEKPEKCGAIMADGCTVGMGIWVVAGPSMKKLIVHELGHHVGFVLGIASHANHSNPWHGVELRVLERM